MKEAERTMAPATDDSREQKDDVQLELNILGRVGRETGHNVKSGMRQIEKTRAVQGKNLYKILYPVHS